jgi:hypothetical protein
VGLAGVALAGCERKLSGGGALASLSDKEISDRVSEFIAQRGIDNYGANPNGPMPDPSVPFNPGYMALIHMTSAGPWEIRSNHAHFAFSQTSYDKPARIARASAIFANKLGKTHKRFRDEPRGSHFQVYDIEPGLPVPQFADQLEFANFYFGHQHDLYIFYEHKPGELKFDTITNRLVTFSQFHGSGEKADENHAFFNAELITDPALLGKLKGRGSLIRLENHFTVKDGTSYFLLPHGATDSQHYKMNLIYVAGSGIVMAIDPDIGNGGGRRP